MGSSYPAASDGQGDIAPQMRAPRDNSREAA